MKNPGFKFLEHTADIKIRAQGKTINEVFENCALAISNFLSRGKPVKTKIKKKIKVEGTDNESLLYAFLDELIFLLDAENFVVAKASVKIKGGKLEAALTGDKARNYDLDHIKAATYAEMYVKKTKSGFEAQFVMDV